jgi:hypothetical protein
MEDYTRIAPLSYRGCLTDRGEPTPCVDQSLEFAERHMNVAVSYTQYV